MNAELIAVGSELLMGQIANTDAQYISSRLSSLGVNVHFHTVVGDNRARLTDTLKIAFSRSECVILTGGLGPTYDDMTKETVASFFNLPLSYDKRALEELTEYFEKRKKVMTPSNKKQALLPGDSKVLYNEYGTAPGCIIEKNGKIAAMLPGPPREMRPMFDKYLYPYFKEKTGSVVYSEYLHLFGIGEAEAESKISHLTGSENPTVAPYVSIGETVLRISASAANEKDASLLTGKMKNEIYSVLGEWIYAEGRSSTLPQTVLRLLTDKKLKLAAAESCTGGMVSSAITDLPGSSEVFLYGAVTYANSAKMSALSVSPETLKKHGAVSEETAIEMARGVRLAAKSDIGVSTTGIAGPGGGTPDKPIGTVYIAISTGKGDKAIKLFLPGDRARVRKTAVLNVYDLIRRTVLSGNY